MAAIADETMPRRRGNTAGWAATLLDLATRSHVRAAALLLALSLAAFLPGFASLQPMDRDEPRFAQASKQMLESGDLVDIRFQDEARHKKPVGIYWLQSATVAAAERFGVAEARTTIALYRLPSLAGAVAVVLLTYWAALALGGRRAAFLAACFMAASILLGVEARLAKTDAVLSAACVALMGGLARAYLARGAALARSTIVVFWLAMALAILVKGPVAPMIAGLAALVLSVRERSGRWLAVLRPWLGLAMVLVAVLPWFVAIAVKSGGAFFTEAVGKDMLGKVGGGQERHWGPPGAYLIAFFGTFWPLAPLAAMAVPWLWQTRRDDAIAFCLAWIIPSWLVFEAVPTKLPHYVLPLYPAIAILVALALGQGSRDQGAMDKGAIGPQRRGASLVALLLPLIPIAVLVGLAVIGLRLDGIVPFASMPVLALSVGVALAAWFAFVRERVLAAALLGVVASLILSSGVYGLAQPALRSLKLSPRLVEAAHALGCPQPALATAGYREPSLVFLAGTDLAMLDGAEAARFLAAGGCRVAFVEAKEEAAFTAAARTMGLAPRLVTRVGGFNINGGKHLDIAVYATGA